MNGKALIWDLDGTLLDSYGVIASSLRQTLEGCIKAGDKPRIKRFFLCITKYPAKPPE